MALHPRVLNVTRGYHLKYRHALRGIENCALTWVEEGSTVRDLTLAESIARRNEMAKHAEPLATAEIPGLIFKGPKPTSYGLISAAHEFCAAAVSV